MRNLAIVGFLLTLLPLPAMATEGFSDGHELLEWCDAMETEDISWGLCVGSITAVHDTIMTYQNADAVNIVVCTTMMTTRGDVVKAVISNMRRNPEQLDYALGDVVLEALAEEFPCQ